MTQLSAWIAEFALGCEGWYASLNTFGHLEAGCVAFVSGMSLVTFFWMRITA
jgi:hypothetical protein